MVWKWTEEQHNRDNWWLRFTVRTLFMFTGSQRNIWHKICGGRMLRKLWSHHLKDRHVVFVQLIHSISGLLRATTNFDEPMFWHKTILWVCCTVTYRFTYLFILCFELLVFFHLQPGSKNRWYSVLLCVLYFRVIENVLFMPFLMHINLCAV